MSLPYKSLLPFYNCLFCFSQNKIHCQKPRRILKTESSVEIFRQNHAIYGELGGTSNGFMQIQLWA